jgi:hypothetical protein
LKLFFSNQRETVETTSPVLSVLDRLWQIKIQSIALVAFWTGKSKDEDIRSGLQMQLEDERRHLRLIGEEIRRQGGRVSSERREGTVGRAFGLIKSQATDLRRLCCYYRGIKLTTHSRASQLQQAVEPSVAELLGQIARDEERHVRWADIRISHLMTAAEMRECNHLVDRMDAMIDASWQKLWLDCVRTKMLRPSRAS